MIFMRFLISGGAGFIGSNYVKHIVETDPTAKCMVLDSLTYAGNIMNIKAEIESKSIGFVCGDITNTLLVSKLFEDYSPDIVINFAAESHVDRSIESSDIFIRSNVMGAHNLLNIAKNMWQIHDSEYREGTRFIQISTDEVYGSLGKDGDFTENTPLNPRSPYSASKASADLIAGSFHETYDFPLIITRCSNNYGPHQFPEKLIPLMIKNILDGKQLPIYGDGKNIRDWIHVSDHCKAIDTLVHDGKIGEIYNVGARSEKQNIEIVKILIDTVRSLVMDDKSYQIDHNINIEKINYDLLSFVKDRPGHDFRYSLDNSKILRKTDWKPEIKFEDGITDTIRWYLDNYSWVQDIEAGRYEKYNNKHRM